MAYKRVTAAGWAPFVGPGPRVASDQLVFLRGENVNRVARAGIVSGVSKSGSLDAYLAFKKSEALVRSHRFRPVAPDVVIPAPQTRSVNLVGGAAAESRTRIPCQGHRER